ncbi:MAG: transposase [Proteobacteria bacterium]|nr:transposase [Pseudomonadota bacterium]
MARPIRLEYSGALYHITSRGDRQEDIYETNTDRENYLSILNRVCETYNWVCHAYCLMSNHYHLLIETPDANLCRGMRQLNGVYTQSFNRAHRRVGHVFQGRYKAILAEKESYLLELSRYIVLNPVRAGMVSTAGDWPWSSYRATAGQIEGIACLKTQWLLAVFDRQKSRAIKRYQQFVSEGIGQPSLWSEIRRQVYLGSEAFLEKMQAFINDGKDLSEVPSSQCRPPPVSLAVYTSAGKNRNTAIYNAYLSGGYTLKEIGDYYGLHYSTVSGIIRNHKSKT